MTDYAKTLANLRKTLMDKGVDAFILPYRNRFQAHFLRPHDERIRFVSGFEGSAGYVAVTLDDAAVFYDQRYAIAVEKQVDGLVFERVDYHETMPLDWVIEKVSAANKRPTGRRALARPAAAESDSELARGTKVAVDGWLHSIRDVQKMRSKAAITLLPENPVDAIWTDRPVPEVTPAHIHPVEIAGQTSAEKRNRLAGDRPILITAMDSIGWLLNIRGGDTPYMPALEATAILYPDASLTLFCDPGKVTDTVRAHLGEDVTIPPFSKLEEAIATLPNIQLDETSCPAALEPYIKQYKHAPDPCLLPKACKNETEQAAIRNAHERDGLALTRFLIWLSTIKLDGSVSELDISAKLDAFRAEHTDYLGHSFPNIVGFGAHSASIHTILNEDTNQVIDKPGMVLIDSGGQYLDGTTDVTRTICIGDPTEEMKHHYTLVLKGHIAMSSALFPSSATGAQLDTLARQFLWSEGKDYAHGTGHGVGLYGDVHEGPCGLSPRVQEKLKPGMLLSIEPGYYQTGDFGIRIENLVLVKESDIEGFLRFDPVTMAPIDTRLIDTSLMSAAELEWLNTYHMAVYDTHAEQLSEMERAVLARMTAPVYP